VEGTHPHPQGGGLCVDVAEGEVDDGVGADVGDDELVAGL